MNIKFIIFFSFLVFTSTSAFEEGEKTLVQWFTQISAKYQNIRQTDPFYAQINKVRTEHWCMNDKLNIWNNKQKKINNLEALIFIYGAALNCVENKVETWKEMVSYLGQHYAKSVKQNQIECFKMELQKLDPYNFLLKHDNFRIESMNTDIETCTEIVDMAGFDAQINANEQIFGSLSQLTCGFTKDDFKKYMLTVVVLSDTSLEINKKNYAIKDAAKKLREIMDKAFACVKNDVNRRRI